MKFVDNVYNYFLNIKLSIFYKKESNVSFLKQPYSTSIQNYKLSTYSYNNRFYYSDLSNIVKVIYLFIIEELYKTKNLFFNSNLNWLYAFGFILFIDACLTDDEPLWDPVEWSLVQVWILFIFSFSWIIENLLSSRYGSYVGRDKRVWLGWFKTHWFIEAFYALNYGAASVFVITPFYNETRSSLFFVYSWWNWFSRVKQVIVLILQVENLKKDYWKNLSYIRHWTWIRP